MALPRHGDLRRLGRDAQSGIAGRVQARQRGAQADADLKQPTGCGQGLPQQLTGPLLSAQHIAVVTGIGIGIGIGIEDAEMQKVDPPFQPLQHARVDVERERKVERRHGGALIHWCGSATMPCCTLSCTTSKASTCSAAAYRSMARSHSTYTDAL